VGVRALGAWAPALDYALAVVAFGIGLMAKPMLVTLPFVLLLFDVWPLGPRALPAWLRCRRPRQRVPAHRDRGEAAAARARRRVRLLTLHAQKQVGALSNTVQVSLVLRVCNAFIATFVYIAKLFVPIGRRAVSLSGAPAARNAVVAALLLLAVTVLVWRRRHRAPYGLTGWLWFLGTLVPVIGLVQVGSQSMADRYTYIPHIGLYLLLVWAIADALARARVGAAAIAVGASAALAVLAAVAWCRSATGRTARRCFGHTIAVTERNFIATNNYGVEMLEAGRLAQAQQYFELATRYNPRYETALYNLGVAYRKQESTTRPPAFRQALRSHPTMRARAAEPRDHARGAPELRGGDPALRARAWRSRPPSPRCGCRSRTRSTTTACISASRAAGRCHANFRPRARDQTRQRRCQKTSTSRSSPEPDRELRNDVPPTSVRGRVDIHRRPTRKLFSFARVVAPARGPLARRLWDGGWVPPCDEPERR
jgi:tetratricopeptide (TPR) repeat protein